MHTIKSISIKKHVYKNSKCNQGYTSIKIKMISGKYDIDLGNINTLNKITHVLINERYKPVLCRDS